jgi:hypothetical protein
MKKLYNKITQYSITGEKINEFKSALDAQNIAHKDSIVNCCKGKYKLAGGYIWRFDDDPFILPEKTKLTTKYKAIKCKICNSEENIRSMAMHLKHHHNIKTEEYIEKFGEFRPKNLNDIKKTSLSKYECKECGEKVKSNQHLMYHITKKHPNITKSEYIIKHIYNNEAPICKCGCGEKVVILENGNNCDLKKQTYNRDYIKGHWDWPVFSNISKQSKEEIELEEFIRSIYKGEIQTSVKTLLQKREIDIFLPKLNIAIEYNGLYWHSEKGNRLQTYHVDKLNQANQKNIRLIQIFSDEWINKKEIVKSKLKSILNQQSDKIYARNCYIQEIDPKQKNEFLNKNHLQGEDRSSIKLGLFNNNKLMAVMTFSNPRRALGSKQSNKSYELSRYATSKNVIGGASKLLTYFIKNFNPKHIYSYSDNRWTDPNKNMYLSIGFTKTKSSSPGYWYTKNYLIRLHRYNFNKFKLKQMGADVINKTEKQIMEEWGYTRVWDCGTTKYEIFI